MKFISRKIRKNVTTSIFHIMVQGINKEYIFNQEIYIKKYLKFLKENQKQTNLKIIAYCIMTNHAHLLIKAENIQELSKFMQKVNSSYARYYNYMEKRVGYVFRDRFKSQAIMSEKQYYNCIRYIHLNPVKAKIVEKQEDYKYSSYIIYQKRLKKKEKTESEKSELNYICNNNEEIKENFIEVKNDEDINNMIEEFIKTKKLKITEIFENREILKKLIKYLKKEKGIKYTEIMEKFGITKGTMENLKK